MYLKSLLTSYVQVVATLCVPPLYILIAFNSVHYKYNVFSCRCTYFLRALLLHTEQVCTYSLGISSLISCWLHFCTPIGVSRHSLGMSSPVPCSLHFCTPIGVSRHSLGISSLISCWIHFCTPIGVSIGTAWGWVAADKVGKPGDEARHSLGMMLLSWFDLLTY